MQEVKEWLRLNVSATEDGYYSMRLVQNVYRLFKGKHYGKEQEETQTEEGLS